jgi:FdhD protein
MDKQVMTTDAASVPGPDHVVIEEPLQIVVDGHSIAVTMRTPGHDEELALGFLRSEKVISSAAQVRRIDASSRDNHCLVFLAEDVAVDFATLTRHVFSASSCGLCGKASIEAVMQNQPPLKSGAVFSRDCLLAAPEKLAAAQSVFARTGGLHAAGIFAADGTMLVVREDIGRHNAVDKVLGWAMREGRDLSQCFLLVSGRVSFEIMQKALAGGIPLVAAISAPSSLAIEFAERSNQALIAFLRPPAFRIYAGADRLLMAEQTPSGLRGPSDR